MGTRLDVAACARYWERANFFNGIHELYSYFLKSDSLVRLHYLNVYSL